VSGVGEKTVGFTSAAVAIMTVCSGDGAYLPCIVKTYTVAIFDYRYIAAETPDKIDDLLEAGLGR